MTDRRVRWFSAGAPSAVATMVDIAEHGVDAGPVVGIDVGSEHPDNARFYAECSEWFGAPVVTLKSEKYENVDEVIEDRKYIVGPQGAPCTTELKKVPRYAFERPTDIQIYGYTADQRDQERAVRFREQNPGVTCEFPLIDRGLKWADCLAMIERAGIALPAMYLLGYRNNNCIGCVKGAMGYWNKIRVDFPEVFAKRAEQERRIGHAICSEGGADGVPKTPVWLDELDPDRGDYQAEEVGCSLLCAITEIEVAAVPVRLTVS